MKTATRIALAVIVLLAIETTAHRVLHPTLTETQLLLWYALSWRTPTLIIALVALGLAQRTPKFTGGQP